RGKLDLAHKLSLGVDLEDARLAVHSVPDVAIDVDAEAVRAAGALVLVEDALVGDAARRKVVVEGEDLGRGGVSKVHGLVVRRPADRVGDREVLDELGAGAAVEAEEAALYLMSFT